jgi:(p)ppGpp synthase/HD superfamily hydrolase
MSVSALVLEHGGSEDQAIAALLHDAIEDAPAGEGPTVLKEIRERFGDPVAAIVEACSDGLDESGNRTGTWPERKLPYVAGLLDPAKKSDEALLVTAADKIHNGRCIAADLRTYGPGFWSTFNASADELLWYSTSVDAAIAQRLPDTTIAEALHRAVDELVEAAGADRDHIPAVGGSRSTEDTWMRGSVFSATPQSVQKWLRLAPCWPSPGIRLNARSRRAHDSGSASSRGRSSRPRTP